MAYDAVLRTSLSSERPFALCRKRSTSSMPEIPWASIAGLRNVVVHEYFRVDPDTIIDIVDNQLTALANALGSTS